MRAELKDRLLHNSAGVLEQLARLREAAAMPEGGVRVVCVPRCDALRLFQACVLGLQDTGYVPVLLQRDTGKGTDLPPHLHARHVLIICADDDGREVAIGWLRALALLSTRSHLVVIFETPQPLALTPGLRTSPVDRSVKARVARADRWRKRGRFRSADRWLIAATHAARRRGDDATAVRLDLELSGQLLDRNQVSEAADRLRSLLGPATLDWPDHVAVAEAWAELLIVRGHYGCARAWIASVSAEATLRGTELPASMRSRQAELRFWDGRPQLPARTSGNSPEEMGWRALSAWHAGNLPALALLSTRFTQQNSAGDAASGWWAALTRVLLAGTISNAELRERVTALGSLAHPQPRLRLRCLAHVIAAKAFVERDLRDEALSQLSSANSSGPEAVASDRLRASLQSGPPLGAQNRRAHTVPGIDFLSQRSTSMDLVSGLSGLLSIVEDSEDEAAVLSGGCRWICRQAGATAVAVVSGNGETMVAAEGWRRTDLGGEIASILADKPSELRPDRVDRPSAVFVPIRYSGVVIGSVVAKGAAGERAALQQALQAFAALCGSAVRARLDAMAAPARSRELIPEIVGDSPLMQSVRDAIARAAAAPFPVLIEGESGTGKELVARALHRLGPRRDRRLCAVNCAALSDDLVEAELFGHTRGAFTGAVSPRAGLFEEASGGTLFFDEVAELSPRAQAKLLRALQEREIRRVGENAARPVDVRVIAATNTDLADAVVAGRFRDDLRFRLAVVRIRLPPLRERLEDVGSLARVFWRRAATEAGTRAALAPDALARLSRHAWPGNVRELQNVISSLVVSVTARGRVNARHVDQVLSHSAVPADPVVHLETARRAVERRVIAAALVRHAGRRGAAANALGLTRQGLSKALRRLGLAADEDAAGVA